MKFQNYLTEYKSEETEGFDNLWAKIDKDCKKYLSLLKYYPPFVRAGGYPGQLGVSSVRQDRVSMGATSFYGKIGSDFYNKWLQKNGFPRRDKSIVATSSINHAKKFSKHGRNDIFYIFPIGSSWKFAYCKSMDFNYDKQLQSMLSNLTHKEEWLENQKITSFKEWTDDMISQYKDERKKRKNTIKVTQKRLDEFLKKYVLNDSLTVPHKKKYEVWFDCKKFYYISANEYIL